jgi:Ni/Fe-hydrogenase subunit HybB-like protein
VSPASLPRPPLVEGGHTYATLSAKVSEVTERPMPFWWWVAFAFSGTLLAGGFGAATYLISTGVGVWGENNAANWAFDITNFVFWIGIGHAGTLISAILFLLRQRWRTSVNRAAEAMTLFAVMCAGIFPLIHMGRPWMFFWMLPYPNDRGSLWVNFRSPLVWDFFAISTYFTISAIFWYVGLLPDLATLRDREPGTLRSKIFGFLSLGWTGSFRTWHRYEVVYLLLAALGTPLVLSVHTIVSTDFATAVVPGWHTTIFPPYFVAGAIFSGMAMVLTLMLVARKTMRLEDYITPQHIDAMCSLVILTSGLVGLAYGTEFFIAYYSGSPYEQFAFYNRALGPLAWGYWIMVACNVMIPQLFWFTGVRRNLIVVFIISIFINIGMWFERFIIIVASLQREYLPSMWSDYTPTSIEIATFIGTFGLFFTMFLLFCRFVPVIAIAEIKGVLRPAHGSHAAHDSHSGYSADVTPDKGFARP